MSLTEEQIEERCENARDALGYSNACCPRDDVPMCTDCSRLRAPALAVLELADDVESARAEVRRLREENGALMDRLIGAATVLPDLRWKDERDAAKAALARAVELLRIIDGADLAPEHVGVRAFLKEHGAK